jgi:ATP-dependent Clp protease ATP-binding subunit ClpC
MHDRFTERGRKVMQLAEQEARFFNHEYVGTEHILLGLVKEGSGVAANVLKNLDIDLRKIRLEVERIVQPGPDAVIMGKLPQTPRAKKVIEYAIEEARNLNHNDVGTDHLLLGLLREEEGVASVILTNLGLRLEDVRERIRVLPGRTLPAEEAGDTGGERQASKGKSKTPALDSFGRDLTELARQGKLAPLIGRVNEIERVIQVLSRPTKNNPLLLGEPGVGKTAIVEGLARRIVDGLVPERLRTRRVVVLDLATLIASDKQSNQFEERIKAVLSEACRAKNVILLFDALPTLVGASGLEGVDATPWLIPALARGAIQCIGESTLEEYRKYVERDGALERRYQHILVNPPSKDEAVEILAGCREHYEALHRVKITDGAIAAAVELSGLYLPELFLLRKATNLIDDAASRVSFLATGKSPDLEDLDAEIDRLNVEKESAVAWRDFEKAALLRDRCDRLKKTRERIARGWLQKAGQSGGTVDAEAVIEALSRQTGIPAGKIRERDTSMVTPRPRPGPAVPGDSD